MKNYIEVKNWDQIKDPPPLKSLGGEAAPTMVSQNKSQKII